MNNFKNKSLYDLLNIDPKLITDDILDYKLNIKPNLYNNSCDISNILNYDEPHFGNNFTGYSYSDSKDVIWNVLNYTSVSKKFILDNAKRIGYKNVILYADIILSKKERIDILKDNFEYIMNICSEKEINEIKNSLNDVVSNKLLKCPMIYKMSFKAKSPNDSTNYKINFESNYGQSETTN